MLSLNDIDYKLPETLIANHPSETRSQSKLMSLNKHGEIVNQSSFKEIVNQIPKDALLVFNDTKVMSCRFFGHKESGAKLELFLLKDEGNNLWRALTKCSGKIKVGHKIIIDSDIEITVSAIHHDGERSVQFPKNIDVYKLMDTQGSIPLPPYIARDSNQDDKNRYQTVYAKQAGAVAAPTAGLHFDTQLLDKLKRNGVEFAHVTLHVGMGTFKPISSDSIVKHTMHSEDYIIDKTASDQIEQARLAGRPIIPVGTTSVRTLESAFAKYGKICECSDSTTIFLYPPYKMKICNGLITNFHLPKSTLLLLVGCFVPLDILMTRYQDAIKNKYRFFSYGDAMYISP